eukprot:TRINITY_DN4540_c0_g1_i1.p1 TRINITY_DN4540_c0_g1~~TRINITY_DN4540_c0_g1_i1.p1  ORF type:complete len:244 (+),score=23.32 TRINITY_DN4540_c0_g1_i1:28-759(+)
MVWSVLVFGFLAVSAETASTPQDARVLWTSISSHISIGAIPSVNCSGHPVLSNMSADLAMAFSAGGNSGQIVTSSWFGAIEIGTLNFSQVVLHVFTEDFSCAGSNCQLLVEVLPRSLLWPDTVDFQSKGNVWACPSENPPSYCKLAACPPLYCQQPNELDVKFLDSDCVLATPQAQRARFDLTGHEYSSADLTKMIRATQPPARPSDVDSGFAFVRLTVLPSKKPDGSYAGTARMSNFLVAIR